MPQHEERGRVSPPQVAEHLKGMNFPCSKEDLVNHCGTKGCPTEIRAFLEKMPERQYFSMADVTQSIGQIE